MSYGGLLVLRCNRFGRVSDVGWRGRILKASSIRSCHRRWRALRSTMRRRGSIPVLLRRVLDVTLRCIRDTGWSWRRALPITEVAGTLLRGQVAIIPHGYGFVGRSGGHFSVLLRAKSWVAFA
jgi:hypothetical protein